MSAKPHMFKLNVSHCCKFTFVQAEFSIISDHGLKDPTSCDNQNSQFWSIQKWMEMSQVSLKVSSGVNRIAISRWAALMACNNATYQPLHHLM